MIRQVSIFFLCILFCLIQSDLFAHNSDNDSVKILTWNIFMLPPIIFKSDQMNRADMISESLISENPDIIVFQEAFMKSVRIKIWGKLKNIYPYQSNHPKGTGFLRINSGVWILSKIPFEVLKFSRFKNCKTSDCQSGKGVYLMEFTKNGKKFQLAGTHTQSGAEAETRVKQFVQIKEKVLKPFKKEGIPQLICGDLNVNQYDYEEYRKMLEILEMNQGELGFIKYSYTGTGNDLAQKFYGQSSNQNLDYILIDNQIEKAEIKSRTIHKFTSEKYGKHLFSDLSDHYAVSAILILKN